eukprot:TRINITY_DN8840_c0_g1_i2.p1 TRINITY_DN8840_c0_g1~~TRINITY_DN8840_c0_g1_i2.p1  ORF type:complete len:213 (+),score=16.57 TRINITY_DN8840_c0_g1_i2:103-741(+)
MTPRLDKGGAPSFSHSPPQFSQSQQLLVIPQPQPQLPLIFQPLHPQQSNPVQFSIYHRVDELVFRQIQELEHQVEDLKQQLNQSHSIRTTFAAEIDIQSKHHQQIVANLTELVNKLQSENQILVKANQEYFKKISELTNKLHTMQIEIDDLQNKHECLAQLSEWVVKLRNLVIVDMMEQFKGIYYFDTVTSLLSLLNTIFRVTNHWLARLCE